MVCSEFVMKTVVAEHCLHMVRSFPASQAIPASSRLGMHESLRCDTARTADSNWPKEYSVLRNMMIINKKWGKKKQGSLLWGCGCSGQAGHCLDNGEQSVLFCITCFYFFLALLLRCVVFFLSFFQTYEAVFIFTYRFSNFCPSLPQFSLGAMSQQLSCILGFNKTQEYNVSDKLSCNSWSA